MSWEDRVQEAAYISPSGARRVFVYEDVSQTWEKLTAAYEFPDGAGTYVQDLGRSGRRFPMRVIFWGDDHDLDASDFEDALRERGRGTLEHPFYGTFRVVPFGTVERVDRLKTQANQTVIEVTFWESVEAPFVTDQTSIQSVAFTAVVNFATVGAQEFDDRADVDTAVERVSFREQMRSRINAIRSAMTKVADTVDSVRRQFETVYNSINTGLDLLVGTPLTLASQVLELAGAPARAAALIGDKLDAYRNLADSIFDRALPTLGLDSRPANEFLSLDFTAQSAVSGATSAVLQTKFSNQPEAIRAADSLATLFDDFTAWRETGFDTLSVIDTGAAYNALQQAVAAALQYVVDLGLQLPQERVFPLLRARNVVELVAELYGSLDALDDFIALNQLTGDEIMELPVGRVVRYYA